MIEINEGSVEVMRNGTKLATCWGMGRWHPDMEKALASAKLFDAAEDLLEACKIAAEELGGHCDIPDCGMCNAYDALIAAITKAEGNDA